MIGGRGLLTESSGLVIPNVYSDSTTLALKDSLGVQMTKGTANTLTVPPNSDVPFRIGTIIPIEQYGAGQTTVQAGAGVTLRSRGGLLALAAQYSVASLRKIATDEWLLAGDLA